VAGQSLASVDDEVDRGWWIGQHGEVGSSIGVSRGGVAHWALWRSLRMEQWCSTRTNRQ
jgi:hypothetical protein